MEVFKINHHEVINAVRGHDILITLLALRESNVSMYTGDHIKFDKISFPEEFEPEESGAHRCWAIAVDGKEILSDLTSSEANFLFLALVRVYLRRKG